MLQLSYNEFLMLYTFIEIHLVQQIKGDQICCSFFDQANEMKAVALNQSDRNCKIISVYASKQG